GSWFAGNEHAGGNPPVELGPDLGERGLTHRAPEPVPDELALIRHRLALHRPVAGPGHGGVCVRCPAGRLVRDSAAPRLAHDSLGLIPVRGGDLAVAREHLVRTEPGLGVSRAVRRDLGRPRALQPSRFKMLADLPAARTARPDVLAGI